MLATVSILVLMCVGSPLLFVAIQALQVGWSPVRSLAHRPLVRILVWHTVILTSAVTVTTSLLGFGAAYLVERTDLPCRRTIGFALVLPLAIPEFVQGFAWVSLTTNVRGYWGAVLVMTCSLYPLVYLPVAASLRRSDPALEEVSRSLGHGWLYTTVRVTAVSARTALGGGALLVGLYLLGEYGAFAALRFQTFATAIYTEYRVAYDAASASLLTLLLCVVALVLVTADARLGGRRPTARSNADGRRVHRTALGRGRWPALAALLALLGVALGVPIAALFSWFARGNSSTLPSASILGEAWTTLGYAVTAAVVATVAALPPALYSWRHRSRLSSVVERGAYLTRALPGIAVGLSIIFAAIHYAPGLYDTPAVLVAGYVVLFFPLALTGIRAGLAGIPTGLDEVARSLGVRRRRILLRITLPLVLPGIGVAAALVALSVTTELTGTLLLRPIGTDTLATQFWTYTTGLAYGAAAPYAAVMIGLSILPVVLLARRGAAALTVTDLTASHGGIPVLHGVGLTVPEHALASVIGPSGCGKTTLLRAIAGFHRPDSGRIRLADTEIDGPGRHLRAEDRRIGYIPQNVALFPHLDVAANIGFGLSRRQRGDRVAELLSLIGLQALGDRLPHQLSGGQQQRVALARALAPRPELLLLDEPFSALDAALRHRVRTEVADLLRATGTAAVLVTHDAAEALDFASHITVLEAGHVLQSAAATEVFHRPANAAVARALGEANVLTAVVESGRARTALGTVPVAASDVRDAVAYDVLVRPRQVVLSGERLPESVEVTVLSCRFQGETQRVEVSVAGHDGPVVVDCDAVHTVGGRVFATVRGPVHALR